MLQFIFIFFYLVGIKTVLGYIYNNFKSVVAVIISLFKENIYPRKKINLLELYGNWAGKKKHRSCIYIQLTFVHRLSYNRFNRWNR